MTNAMTNAPGNRWVYGPAPDLLLGCGLAYAAMFVVLAVAGDEVQIWIPLWTLALVNLFIGVPHYGATLIRVYENPEDRRRYRYFAIHATLLMCAVFLAGLYNATVGSCVYTLYLTWSPWHYSSQNYGLASMFLRRRGVELTPVAKRALHASFVLSFALTFFAIHTASPPSGIYTGSIVAEAPGYAFIPLGIPTSIGVSLLVLTFLAYLASLVVTAVHVLRRGSFSDLGPTATLVASQALWFSVPVMARATNLSEGILPFSVSNAEYMFWWITFAHGGQYLWITSYYAKRRDRDRLLPYFGRAVLVGSALWGAPALIFATAGLGPVPYDKGLFILIASVVNIHHFILDGAIWKLRDGRVAQMLLGAPASSPTEGVLGRSLGSWPRRLVWVVGAVCALQVTAHGLETEFGMNRATLQGNFARLRESGERLKRIGLANPDVDFNLGLLLAEKGELAAARAHLETSIEAYPTALAWTALGQVHARAGDERASIAALEAALELDPRQVTALHQLGLVWLRLGELSRAREVLERAKQFATGSERAAIDETLGQARQRAPAQRSPEAYR